MSNILWDNDTPINKIALRIKGVKDAKRIGAGAPVNANGEIVNDNTAIGLTLQPTVYPYKKPIDILTAGCVDEKARLKESEIELSEDCKAALSKIKLFNTDNMSTSWNDLKDKPFYEEECVLFEGDIEITTESLYYLENPIGLSKQNRYKAIVNGAEYESEYYWDDTGDGDTWYFKDEEGKPLFCYYGNSAYFSFFDEGTFHVKIVDVANSTLKTLDEKYIPDSVKGGGSYDAVINLGTYSDTNTLSDLTGGSVPVGTVKMIEAKIAAGEMPKLKGVITYSYYDFLYKGVFEFTAVSVYGNNQVKCYCEVQTYSGHYSLIVNMRDDDNGAGIAVDRIVDVTIV